MTQPQETGSSQRGQPSADQPKRRRLDQVKVTPLVFIAFFAALALMSGAAALVGYVTHALSHGVHP